MRVSKESISFTLRTSKLGSAINSEATIEQYIFKTKQDDINIINLKKTWEKRSKGKTMDKLNNLVLFDRDTYDKLLKEAATSLLSGCVGILRERNSSPSKW